MNGFNIDDCFLLKKPSNVKPIFGTSSIKSRNWLNKNSETHFIHPATSQSSIYFDNKECSLDTVSDQ
jgi:hypothetical protein